MKKSVLLFAALLILAGCWIAFSKQDAVELVESDIMHRFEQDGTAYVIYQGDYYNDHKDGTFSFVQMYRIIFVPISTNQPMFTRAMRLSFTRRMILAPAFESGMSLKTILSHTTPFRLSSFPKQ